MLAEIDNFRTKLSDGREIITNLNDDQEEIKEHEIL